MIDTANPADPTGGGGSTTTPSLSEGVSLRRNRWLATEAPAVPPGTTWVPVLLVVALGTVLRPARIRNRSRTVSS